MANHHRGETSFRAGGRECFVVYGTREIAEIQTALGFRRPNPFEPPTYEDVQEEQTRELEPGKTVTEIVTKRIRVDYAERYRRVQDAFDGLWLNCFKDPGALRVCVRAGLQRWAAQACEGGKLTDEIFDAIADDLGLEGLAAVHAAAWMNASPDRPAGGEDSDPNPQSAESASSTSSPS
jgi:hypothetical protein